MTGRMRLSQKSGCGSDRATIEAATCFAALTPALSQTGEGAKPEQFSASLALWERDRG